MGRRIAACLPLVTCALAWALPATPVNALPLLIDDFERGRISDPAHPAGTISDDTADGAMMLTAQPGLPAAHAAFPRRFVGVNLQSGGPAATAALAPDAADAVDDALTFTLPANASAKFTVGYDSATVDLTAGGNDRLAFTLTGAPAGTLLLGGGGALLDGDWRTIVPVTIPLNGAGEYVIPFDTLLPRDANYPTQEILRHVDGLEFVITAAAAASAPRTFGVSDFRAIPEPTGLPLVAAAAVLRTNLRRRPRRRRRGSVGA